MRSWKKSSGVTVFYLGRPFCRKKGGTTCKRGEGGQRGGQKGRGVREAKKKKKITHLVSVEEGRYLDKALGGYRGRRVGKEDEEGGDAWHRGGGGAGVFGTIKGNSGGIVYTKRKN